MPSHINLGFRRHLEHRTLHACDVTHCDGNSRHRLATYRYLATSIKCFIENEPTAPAEHRQSSQAHTHTRGGGENPTEESITEPVCEIWGWAWVASIPGILCIALGHTGDGAGRGFIAQSLCSRRPKQKYKFPMKPPTKHRRGTRCGPLASSRRQACPHLRTSISTHLSSHLSSRLSSLAAQMLCRDSVSV